MATLVWLARSAAEAPQLDELTVAQLEALYAELEIISDRIGSLLEARELRELRSGLASAKRTVYARLMSPVHADAERITPAEPELVLRALGGDR